MPTIKRNINATSNIQQALKSRVIQNLVSRISPYQLTLRNITKSGKYYAIVGNKNEFLGFAVVSNHDKQRHLELIATRKGYGDMLIRRIINNAKNNNKKNITLEAAANALVNLYKKYGFHVTSGRHMRLSF